MKNLSIHIKLSGDMPADTALQLRYTVVDTIEERSLGAVVNEGMGEDYMDIDVELAYSDKADQAIKSILQSLDLLSVSTLTYEEVDY